MSTRRLAISSPLILALGIALGVAATGLRPSSLRAMAGDRVGESVLATGPITIEYNAGKKVPVSQEGLYYLDYSGGRLLAAVPSLQQTVGGSRVLGDFAERDLIADFKLGRNASPHFLMTTGTLGAQGEPWAPIYVLETTTRKVAIYRVSEMRTGTSSRPRFELLELRAMAPSAFPAPAG